MQKDNFDLTSAQKNHLLEAQAFTAQQPGTIVRDFEALLDLIGERGLPTTPAHLFAMKTLETINQRLTHPLKLGLKRVIQKSCPHINGLYLVLRASGLGVIDGSRKPITIKTDPQVLASWRSLNFAERYFALLEAWWGRANEELIGQRLDWQGTIPMRMDGFIRRFVKTTGHAEVQDAHDHYQLGDYPSLHNLALMELFGLIEIAVTPPGEGQGWLPRRMMMTDWGKALLGGYMDFIYESLFVATKPDLSTCGDKVWIDPEFGFTAWRRTVQPLIPDWRRDLEIARPPFQPGPHVFKVWLSEDCWRRIAIQGDVTFDELRTVVAEAFDLDKDCLYEFSYQDRFGRIIHLGDPEVNFPNWTDAKAVRIGDLPLMPGMRLGFRLNLGYDWEAIMETERVNADLAIAKAQVLEQQGCWPP